MRSLRWRGVQQVGPQAPAFKCKTSNSDPLIHQIPQRQPHGHVSTEPDTWWRTCAHIHTAFLSPSCIIEGLQSSVKSSVFYHILISFSDAYLPTPLRLTSAIQAFLAPEPSPSDFWEKAKGYEQILQDYVPLLLTSADSYFKSTAFSDIAYSMKNIVHTTATFRDNIQDTLDAYHITIDSLTKELETVFMTIVDDLKNIPPPSKASGHAERDEVVNKILDDTELALVNLATRHGIQEDVVTTYLDTLRPHLRALIVAVGMSISSCSPGVDFICIT